MTSARLLCCTLALAFAACATPVRAHQPTSPTRYELCSDPRFECIPASLSPMAPAVERPIQIDTNLSSPSRTPALG